jgi:D-tagatose-1,6-bisphosphate aldolase subunit GatZ/KbaZ
MSVACFRQLADRNRSGEQAALPSFCTANGWVLDAIFDFAAADRLPVLVEATCNQVNQFGGYSGMLPAEYRTFVRKIAHDAGYVDEDVLFGGDHLGPNPWKLHTAEVALAHAAELVRTYSRAGFTKIHLDASMRCARDAVLSPPEVADRTARLCLVAEQASTGMRPSYVIGTEVPTPGGETDELCELSVTDASNVAETVATHRRAFLAEGLEDAWGRVVAVVTQPGVDFSHSSVHRFEPEAASGLAAVILDHAGLTYEAHSTDYQTVDALRGLVASHYAFLKVGPELTFAFREAIVLLTLIESQLVARHEQAGVIDAVMAAMSDDPQHWETYYQGDERSVAVQKLFSYSDRIRYYWGTRQVSRSLEKLFANLKTTAVPETLISQYFPQHVEACREARPDDVARLLVRKHVQAVVARYYAACGYGAGVTAAPTA